MNLTSLIPPSMNLKEAQEIQNDSPRNWAYRADFASILSERYREIIQDQLPRLLRDQVELGEIRSALERVKQGTFGACQTCGTAIAHELLLKVPFARQCFECQQNAQSALRA